MSLSLLLQVQHHHQPKLVSSLYFTSFSYHSSSSPLTLAQRFKSKPTQQKPKPHKEPESENPDLLQTQTQTQPQPSLPKPQNKNKLKTKAALAISGLINTEPWSSQLESRLNPLLQNLSKTSFLQTISLIKNPSKSILFFKWAHLQGLPHPHHPSSVHRLLLLLTRSRRPSSALRLLLSLPPFLLSDRLFNSLSLSFARSGLLRQSLLTFRLMPRLGVPRSVFSFNTILSVLLRRGRTQLALQIYREMRESDRIDPDVCTFNTLIRGFCLNSMVDEGFRFFKEMARFKCSPDVVTYNTLVDGLCRAGKVRIGHNLLKGMRKKGPDLSPNVVTYTTVIRGYCDKQLVNDALKVFDEMTSRGVNPNSITFNTLIQGLCEARELDKIKEILQEVMENEEFRPDTCTFNTLMTAHCNAGKLDDALKMFEKMCELKVDPDSATYSILIRCLCESGDFERAEELLDELEEKGILLRREGCVPLVAAYNPIFEYLCARGKTEKAETVFRQLLKRGTQDPPAFKTLILGRCKEGAFRDGYELLVLMLRRDFVPDVETYDSLIEGFLRKGESSSAHVTLEKMLKSSHHPKTSTFHSILAALISDGCAREAASLITVMLERRIRQNINLSTDTIIALFKSGNKDTAFEVAWSLYDNGYTVKMEKLVDFLCLKNKFSEASHLLLFCLEKHGNLDIGIYSTVVRGLCEIHRASEAFHLFYELMEKGGKLDLNCLTDLKIALEADGRSKEAEFVSKKIIRR
ncbi:pentatricopeptide repeat-containing protein, chloroplastic [Cinnamomum micranthum f. kanehirae]|uniref:Pentatricopeptide repeat-containing protein, chloroplastic n=1 Tax=Cinnamomum micranthum f. kanehirae TaxID=337451 RepID=A0A443PAA2_9MAGN|nr:pentatricopeptide repeat-containing protein, chloroplastic [Cinnamomum micranthum f. kanehirae]